MKTNWFQVSIKTVLVCVLVVAAYLAGRTPWERAATTTTAESRALKREKSQVSLYAAMWQELALESRDDLRASEREWDMHSAARLGHGGSFPGSPNSESIRPRAKRWIFAFSRDIAITRRQLESLESAIVGVWDDPARVGRWEMSSSEFCDINENDRLERWLIMAGSEELFAMLPDSVFSDEPRFVLLAIPREFENRLAMLEHQQLAEANATIQEIATTTFGFVDAGGSFEPKVVGQTLKLDQ